MNRSLPQRAVLWALLALLLLPVTWCGAQGAQGALGGQEDERIRDLKRIPVKDVPPLSKWALVVGVSGYQRATKLNATINDAKQFKDFLIRSWGFREEHVILMTDDSPSPNLVPTGPNLMEQMEFLVKGANRDSQVVFYFSGHGVSIKPKDYLVPLDGRPSNIERTCVSFTDFREELKAKNPKRALLFVDACRNLEEGVRSGINNFGSGKPPAAPEIATLYSCEPGQLSRESKPPVMNGVFTRFLLQGLGGDPEAAAPDGAVTFDTLSQWLRAKVLSYVQKEYSAIQSPLGESTLGAMVLARAFDPPPPPDDKKARARALISEAYRQLSIGKALQANELAREALKLDPDNAEGHYIVGRVYLLNKQFEDALREFSRAKELNKELLDVDQRIKEAQDGIPKPQEINAAALLRQAEQHLAAGELNKAELVALVVLGLPATTNEDKAVALSIQGRVHEKTDPDKALKAFQEAVKLNPVLRPAVEGLERLKKLQAQADLQGKVNQALQHIEAGRTGEADLLVRQVLSVEPDNARAHYILGRVLVAQNRLDDAVREFELAIQRDSTLADAAARLKDAQARLKDRQLTLKAKRAEELLKQNDLDGAATMAQDVMKEASTNKSATALANYVLGAVLEKRGKYQEALGHYGEALRLEPGRDEAREAQQRVLKSIGQADLNRLVTEALQLLAQGRTADASAKAREIIARAPENGEAHYVLGQGYAAENRFDDAIRELQEAKRLSPSLAQVDSALTDVRGRQNKLIAVRLANEAYDHLAHREFADAVSKSRKSAELDAANAKAYAVLGNALVWVNDGAGAGNALDQAARLDSNMALAFVGKGTRALIQAEKHILDSFRLNKPDLAKSAEPLLAEAEQALRQAIRIQTNELLAHNNLASVYNDRYLITGAKEQLDLAEAEIQKALELDRDYPVAFFNLGSVYLSKGQPKPAEDCFRKAISKYPENGMFYAGLAASLLAQNRRQDAEAQAAIAKNKGILDADHYIFDQLKKRK